MSTPTSEPILTAAETRAAEQSLFDAGTDPLTLMEQAGRAVAEAVAARFAAQPVLVTCGPGNNGGDGYVIARVLSEWGWPVRVAALADPATDSARAMCGRWIGPIEAMKPLPAPGGLVIDALFGIGSRAIDPNLSGWLDGVQIVAVDQPSGLDTDTGAARGREGRAALTVALGALKPVHAIMPAAGLCGEIVIAPIGLPVPRGSSLTRIGAPALRMPDATSNKYTRGKVVVVAGGMPGAAHLSAVAAQRAAAGYVELVGDDLPFGTPYALVRRAWSAAVFADERVGAVVIGPGLDDGDESQARVRAALQSDHPLVIDAGALKHLAFPLGRRAPTVMTPHAGEFAKLFGPIGGDPLAAVRAGAEQADAVVVLKGAATIIAAPDGRAAVSPIASPWLATAGTGDVLAGICGTMLAQAAWHGFDAFAAAQAAVWLHLRAAERAGPALIADDLLFALKTVIVKA